MKIRYVGSKPQKKIEFDGGAIFYTFHGKKPVDVEKNEHIEFLLQNDMKGLFESAEDAAEAPEVETDGQGDKNPEKMAPAATEAPKQPQKRSYRRRKGR